MGSLFQGERAAHTTAGTPTIPGDTEAVSRWSCWVIKLKAGAGQRTGWSGKQGPDGQEFGCHNHEPWLHLVKQSRATEQFSTGTNRQGSIVSTWSAEKRKKWRLHVPHVPQPRQEVKQEWRDGVRYEVTVLKIFTNLCGTVNEVVKKRK